MKAKMIKELHKEFQNLRVSDTVYRVKGTEIKELELQIIDNSNSDYIAITWGRSRMSKILIFADKSIKSYKRHSWEDASDEYFLQEWKAKRQVNKNIGMAIHNRWSRIQELNKEIKELKNSYFTEVES